MLFYIFVKAVAVGASCGLVYGLLKDYKNILYLFLLSELIILITVLLLASLSNLYLSSAGFTFCIEVISLAAIKAAVGLSIIVSWVRYWGTLNCFK